MNEDLKWLATNVHEWQEGCCAIQRGFDCTSYDFLSRTNADHYGGVGEVCFTRAQWQAARDELSGKPGWDDAPEWAVALGQDSNGVWNWLPHYDESDRDRREWLLNETDLSKFERAGRGSVLGDWRNTLERRPCVSQSAESDTQEDLSVVDDKQWRGPKDGLPPVGLVCESHLIGSDWEVGRIAYIGRNILVWESDSGHEYATRPNDRWFRPLRTEEDKAIEEMDKILEREGCSGYDPMMLKILFANGYRKQEGSK